MAVQCNYNSVQERDMDVLFLSALSTDRGFLDLFLKEAKINGNQIEVESIELSKSDSNYGESDITVIVNTDGKKIGLLLEDKIDAIAMKQQHDRYNKRGEIGIKNGEYQEYHVFIVCPMKYHDLNTEAKKYEHFVSYEVCKEYLSDSNNSMAYIWKQQFEQAIEKAKKPPEVILNEYQNLFFREYLQYQKAYYPKLKCVTKETSNGWWPHYHTDFKDLYLYHKLQEGHVELIFSNVADKIDIMRDVAEMLRSYGINNVNAEITGKSAALRIEVPKIVTDIENAFEKTNKDDLKVCFEAITSLIEFTNLLAKVEKLTTK